MYKKFVIFLLIPISGICQKKISNQINLDEFVNIFNAKRNLIINAIKNWEHLTTINNSIPETNSSDTIFQIVPILKVNVVTDKNDTTYYFSNTDRALIVPNGSETEYVYNIKDSLQIAISSFERLPSDGRNIIKKNQLFALAFFKNEINFFNTYYYENKKTTVIFNNKIKANCVRDFIVSHFGSIQKHYELWDKERKEDKFINAMKLQTTEDAITYIKNDWFLRTKYLPNDSITNIHLLIKNITFAIQLSDNQKKILFEKIFTFFNLMRNMKNFCSAQDVFSYNNFSLEFPISEVLTANELNDCKSIFIQLKKFEAAAIQLISKNDSKMQTASPDNQKKRLAEIMTRLFNE